MNTIKPQFVRGILKILLILIGAAAMLMHPVAARDASRSSQAGKPSQILSVEDYIVDKENIKGRVTVRGSVACMGSTLCYIYGENIMSAVNFNPVKLSREDRKRFLSCNPMLDPCIVTIAGVNQPSETFASILADTVSWEPTEEEIAAADSTLPPCTEVDINDIKSLAESSAIGVMFHLKILKVNINSDSDKNGNKRCIAIMNTSVGEKRLRFYLTRQSNERNFIIKGSWVP